MISSSKVVKSPVLVAVAPTLVLGPLVLIRTCSRSGNAGAMIVRVQKVSALPFCKSNCGVSSQLLKVDVPVPLLKLAAMYALGRPACETNVVVLPWNHPVDPGPG